MEVPVEVTLLEGQEQEVDLVEVDRFELSKVTVDRKAVNCSAENKKTLKGSMKESEDKPRSSPIGSLYYCLHMLLPDQEVLLMQLCSYVEVRLTGGVTSKHMEIRIFLREKVLQKQLNTAYPWS